MPMETPLRESLLAHSQTLVSFLNAAANTPVGERVERLHAHFVNLQDLLDAMVKAEKHMLAAGAGDPPNVRWRVWSADKKIRPVLESTNRLLARYRFVPRLPPVLSGPAVAAESEGMRRERKYGDVIPISETKAVALLVGLAEWRALGFLRRCANCREWFVARRGIDRYCKLACSKQAYRQRHGEEYNEYMRKYRAKRLDHELHGRVKKRKGKRHHANKK